MGVSIPRLQEIQQSSTMPKNDRINLQVNDQASNILNTTNALASLGNKAGDIYQKYENDKIDQLSNAAETEYAEWNDQELTKLKNWKDDPTDAYVEYDKKALEKREEILGKRPDLNDRVKNHLTARLDGVIGKQNTASMKQRGMQQEVYRNNLHESNLKLKRDALPSFTSDIKKGDEDSYSPFNEGMSEIKTQIARHGLKDGTVKIVGKDEAYTHKYNELGEDGKSYNEVRVVMTPMAKQRMAKELSEGVESSLQALIATDGQMEAAKEFREKYKDYITPKKLLALDKKIEGTDRKSEAYKIVGSLRGKSEDEQLATLDKLDPELRSEALKIKDSDDKKIENIRTRKEKANYNTLANNVIARMNSKQPFNGLSELEDDPLYKQTWDNLSPKQKETITKMVDAPKESNPKAELAMQNLLLGRDEKHNIETMTPEDFAEYKAGLNPAARNKAESVFMSLRTQTEGEKRATMNQAGKMLEQELIRTEYIQRNTYGKIAGEDELSLIEANQELIDHIGSQQGVFRPEQLQKFVKEYAAAKIKGKVFNPSPRVDKPKSTGVVPSATSVRDIVTDNGKLLALKRQYREEFGKFPADSEPKFLEYVKRNGK